MLKSTPMKLSDKINKLLPQTQCGLCDYDGCQPYAEAIANNNESINKCLPGGISVLKQLADMTDQDAQPFLAEMETKQKQPMLAVIREHECIGCTKCIKVCPVDAIVGTAKRMHTIIADECTGCELCVPPCPMDCIDMVAINRPITPELSQQFLSRYQARNHRLASHSENEQAQFVQAKQESNQTDPVTARKNEIAAAVARAKSKKKK